MFQISSPNTFSPIEIETPEIVLYNQNSSHGWNRGVSSPYGELGNHEIYTESNVLSFRCILVRSLHFCKLIINNGFLVFGG